MPPVAEDVSAVWELARADIRWRVFDDVVVIYSDRSGATHEFSQFEAWILERLAERPCSMAELAEWAREDVAPGERDAVEQRLRQAMGLFSLQALIRPKLHVPASPA